MTIEYDPNAGDLKEASSEIAFANRLSVRWNTKIAMVPLHGYGVQWAALPPSGELSALITFEHGRDWPDDRPYTTRASRVINGGRMAITLGVPLVVVFIRSPEKTGYFRVSTSEQIRDLILKPWCVAEVREGVSEQWLVVPEENILKFAKGESK